jgi:hypothetical protein
MFFWNFFPIYKKLVCVDEWGKKEPGKIIIRKEKVICF